ncbi:ribonucleoprotein, putative [Entamoeba invadens IP1]|uniref:Ribonucleoprotein, putative n=2 Tax=Entamoeba invadens TaxID=33085 RepID=A0A0A1U6Y1_ENTIV|nr:ribonucleoprotein, putative [Entamoeba invadens IP1]ELP90168.1 ribonucleoprotein, putative [Entamoeba invadens IP1]BAN41091.1 ribonucleoprotein, putative [Entamoeba invadens]BAN41126.1 ribonucleoprotein, putative [Entamoeba invadens]|eukprot:XP_004256939.1 ribonucleoprotein, putative [Entamoeba invadens IP1]
MTKLYIGNLDFQTTNEELKAAFQAYNVVEVNILKTPINLSRGFGFIDVKTEEDAKKALEMDKKTIGKRSIRVELALPEDKKVKREEGARRPYGYHARRPYAPRQNRYARREEGEEPRESRPARQPRFARKPRDTTPKELSETNLFVKNLPFKLSDEEFKKLFEKYEVVEASVVRRNYRKAENVSKGYGFVTLKSAEQQKKAVAEVNGTEIDGRKISVAVAFKRPEKPTEVKTETKTE